MNLMGMFEAILFCVYFKKEKVTILCDSNKKKKYREIDQCFWLIYIMESS